MNTQELFRYIDHTLLKPYADWMEIDKLCREGLAYHTASVCIPPSFVARAREAYPTLRIGTVIGFPLGYQTTAVKVAEAVDAVGNGADELDLVINLGWVKENAFAAVTAEIIAVKAVIGQCLLKVIIETCYLSDAEKQQLCDCVA
ncbi:MAG: deoxyribose-phosphate aldolase, partial [Clostridiales bacterium]